MHRAVLVPLVVACCAVLSTTAAASTMVLTFDSLRDGDSLAGQFPGLAFSNGLVASAGISLNEFEFPPRSGANVAIDVGGDLRIDFASPLSAFGAWFTYLAPVRLQAFDAASTLLASIGSAFGSNLALSGESGSAPNEFLGLTTDNIAYVIVSGSGAGDSFAMDDVTLTTAVPEPFAVGLLTCGVAAWARRRHAAGRRRR